LTGINIFSVELVMKRLQLLRELVPAAARVAVLVDPTSTTTARTTLEQAESAARAIGLQIQVLNARNGREIGAAFAPFERERPDALFVATGPLFTVRRYARFTYPLKKQHSRLRVFYAFVKSISLRFINKAVPFQDNWSLLNTGRNTFDMPAQQIEASFQDR
jgi:hypothetical protein